ncbi:MAG: PP2C family protein-serine/threonine phosphatase, partial [Bacteroidota bacterium]
TLSFAQIRRDGIYIAWIGNSRIYQFRNGELIYMTTDHSWVGEAVKTGLISEEETADHPKSGLITRVIQGSHKSTRVESGLLTDVQRGDVFLMCTGSVSQVWSNEDFVNLFKETTDLDELRAQIISKCALRSRDNFTGIILQVHDARIPANDNPPQAAETIIEPIAPNNPPLTEPTVEKVVEPLIEKVEEPVVTNAPTIENTENSKNFKKYAGFGVIGLLILIIIWKWPSSGASEDSNKESADTTVKANVIMPLDSIKIKDTVKVDTAGKKAKTPEKSNQKTDVKKDTVVKTNPKVQKKPVKQNYRWKRPKKKKKKVYRRNRNSGRQQ